MRYYTPNIEEFYIGFEYEILEDWDQLPNKEWFPQVYNNLSKNPERLEYVGGDMKKLRVKYLDKEDIESLGFKLWQITEDNLSQEFNIDLNKYTIGTVYFNDDNTVDTLELYNTIFTLKNKSELKILLPQLGIKF